jgi:hypothetical protein
MVADLPAASIVLRLTASDLRFGYGYSHQFRQPPFMLLVHAHAGHPSGDIPVAVERHREATTFSSLLTAPPFNSDTGFQPVKFVWQSQPGKAVSHFTNPGCSAFR